MSAAEKLRKECLDLQSDITDVQDRLTSLSIQNTSLHETLPVSHVQAEEEKLLNAQIQALQETPCQVLPEDSCWLKSHIMVELQKDINALEEVQSFVKAQRRTVEKELLQAAATVNTHEKISQAIKEKLHDDAQTASKVSLITGLKKEARDLEKASKQTLMCIKIFMQEHLAQPSVTHDKPKRKKKSEPVVHENTMLQLLQELMSKRVDEPHNPYVTIHENASLSPFIQFLLRKHIAARHPLNCNLLKLLPFDEG